MERKYNLIFLLILAVAFSIISLSLRNNHFTPQADEGYYLKYAMRLGTQGIPAYKTIFREYVQSPQEWFFPNPFRAAYIIASALWLRILGYSFFNLSCLSTVFFLLFLLASFYFSKKYFGARIALLYTLLLTFSPLNMAMSRRALVESAVSLFCSLSIWLFWDYLKGRSRLKLGLFILVFSLALLIKENLVLLEVIFTMFLFIEHFLYKRRVRPIHFVGILTLPVIIADLALVSLGGLPYIFRIAQIILVSPSSNAYAILFGGGPWFRYIIDYLILSPWTLILSIGFVFHFLISKERDELLVYLICAFLLSLFLFDFFTKNVRYVIMLDMFLRFFAVLMLKNLCERFFPKSAFPALFICVMFISAADYLSFYNIFIRNGIYDPVNFILSRAIRIIP